MKKNNLYLSVMIGFFMLISTLIIVILSKFMPFLVSETLYVCKQIPHFFPNIIVYGAGMYGTFVMVKIAIAIYHYKIMVRRYSTARRKHHASIALIKEKYPFLPDVHVISLKEAHAFSLGFLRRNIYISAQLIKKMSSKELEAVILHEYKHVRDFDSLKLFIAFFIETALSFIPSMKEFTISMRIDREIEADGFAVRTQKTNAHILSSLEKFLSMQGAHQPHFVPRFSPGDLLDARVSSLIQNARLYEKHYSIPRFLMSILSLCILSYLALAPVQATDLLLDGKAGVVTCTETSPQCLALCETGASHISKQR